MTDIEGKATAVGMHFAVVASRFNPEIVDRLLIGAKEGLKEAGCDERNIAIIRVPGAFEIPLAVLRAAKSRRYDAIVAIGCRASRRSLYPACPRKLRPHQFLGGFSSGIVRDDHFVGGGISELDTRAKTLQATGQQVGATAIGDDDRKYHDVAAQSNQAWLWTRTAVP